MAEPRRPLYSALGISVTCHAAFLLIILFLASFPPAQVDTRTPPIPTELVFLQESGPGGGGGGTLSSGGARQNRDSATATARDAFGDAPAPCRSASALSGRARANDERDSC